MRLSRYFLPIIKENPAEAKITSHRLMLRAGMIRQVSSGMYNWLPLGLKVLQNVEKIIKRHMDQSGSMQILVPTIQPAKLWQESQRYDDYGQEMLRITDRNNQPLLYGPTAEEVLTDIFRNNVKSYKDLSMNLYQIQWKFRDEIRPRFGIMRGREFLMKDAYSFDLTYEDAKKSYDSMYQTYINIFKEIGLKVIPVKAETGAIGGDLSHEFQVLAETGESQVYYDKKFEDLLSKDNIDIEEIRQLYAMADEMHNSEDCKLDDDQLLTKRGIEVGHIFYFAHKYSEKMKASVQDKDGKLVYPHMGSYGIGVSRLVGAIIESSYDEKGIIWPESVSPFKIGLINLKTNDNDCSKLCDSIYEKLSEKSIDVLYDDTKDSAGKKFSNMDLIGLPWQVAVGPRLVANNQAELKNRKTGEKQILSVDELLNFF